MGLGGIVAGVGKSLHLPELGISEKLGGTNQYTGTLNGHQWIGSAKTYQEALANAQAYDQVHGVPNMDAVANPGAQTFTSPSNGGGGYGGSVMGASTSAPNYALDGAIDGQLGRLGAQEGIGRQNITNSYQSALQRLLNSRDSAKAGLEQSRNETIQGNIKAKDQIGTSVRNTNSGLQRLLGIHGAGSSSAAQVVAPYAAASQGNAQRAQVQNDFSHNMLAVDQGLKDTEDQYNVNLGDLNVDRDSRLNSLLAGIAGTRAQLLGQRSNAAQNQGQINALGSQIDQLGLNPTFTPRAVNVAAPDLAQYNYDVARGPQVGADPTLAQGVGPYLSLLTGGKKKTAGVV